MKRLLEFAVLFVVLYICVPSYGTSGSYFLIYNVSGSVKGVNGNTATTIPWKAYLVVNINNSNGNLVDANLIIYGKDSTGKKVYMRLNKTDSKHYLYGDMWLQGNILVIDAWSNDPFYFEVLALGKEASKNIGYSSTEYVPSSLQGTTMFDEGILFNSSDDLTGTGSASASLWLPETQYANENNWTANIIINVGGDDHYSLTKMLENKGFTDATP